MKVKEVYHINPTFVHVDKDMAEIYAVKEVWNPKVQLCWWHLRKAVRERLKNTKLSTTPYKPAQANAEFPFIDTAFAPLGKADAIETEGLIDIDDEELASNSRRSPILSSRPSRSGHRSHRKAFLCSPSDPRILGARPPFNPLLGCQTNVSILSKSRSSGAMGIPLEKLVSSGPVGVVGA